MEKVKLAILGSTKGTDMQAIIDAIESDELDASIEVVISNKKKAYILERARKHNIPAVFISIKKKKGLFRKKEIKLTREEYDQKVIDELKKYNIDLVLLIGYMRIITPAFVQKYPNKILNVHPSLLPKFAGGMDTNIHEEVLKAGEKETGCTIHIVTEEVDAGPIVIEKKCKIEPDETVESLKAKVQKLEGEAFVEVIKNHMSSRA